MTTIKVPDTSLCLSQLGVMSCYGGISLQPKVCIKPKGHTGHHSDGSATWVNSAEIAEIIARRMDKTNAAE